MTALIQFTGSLLGAFLFMTLFYAFTLTESAGLERLPEKYPKSARLLAFWKNRWALLKITILFFALIFQITSVLSMVELWPPSMRAPAILTTSVMLAVFAHFVPMTVSSVYADRISIIVFKPVAAITFPLYPLSWILVKIDETVKKMFQKRNNREHSPSSEDTIKSIVDNENDHRLDESERKMIRSVLEFSETLVREIMTPRANMVAIEDDSTIGEAVALVRESWQSRIPVFHETLDEIRGIAHVKDILIKMEQTGKDQKISELVSPLLFVPGSMPINMLFERFVKQQIHMAVVLDEYGGTDGLVTMEDVIEELVGEIRDEYDHDESTAHPLHDGSIVVDADMSVSDLNERFNISLPEDPCYETVGGLLLERTGRIPENGEKIVFDDAALSIIESDQRRILKVLVETLPLNQTADAD